MWILPAAESRAAVMSEVLKWSAIAHPTTIFEWQSITVARYRNPSQVGM